ncbi:hypothetical protein [Actinoallomurus sp. NPDC052274]|uniref:hypothetical protein n=1 Tax=Actinoallomurus sp. NPDC052274 TaxID=3155420 RepID=UPI0034297F1E
MSRGVVLLPVTTLRLAGRHLATLTLLFGLGYLARYALTSAGVAVSHGHHEQLRRVLAVLILTGLITITLAVTVGMLNALRGTDGEPFLDAIGRALLPFVVIYVAWGMYLDDVRAFSRADVERNLNSAAHGSVAGFALDVRNLWLALVATAVAWALRTGLERYRRRRPLAVLLAYCETAFNLFAVSSVLLLAGKGTDWVTSRRVWPGGGDLPYQQAVGFAFSTLALPLVWLAMASVVYGLGVEPDDHEAVLEGTRLQGVAQAGAEHRNLVRLLSGQRERWVPLLHATRLILRAGAPALGLFCLCYYAVDLAVAYGFRGALHLVGPDHDPAAWPAILVPLEFARELVRTVLHLALLAAAVGVAGGISAETAAPEGDPVATEPAGTA